MAKMRVPAGVQQHSDGRWNKGQEPLQEPGLRASKYTETSRNATYRADTVSPARGLIIGTVAGIGFWAFLFAAAYLVGTYPAQVVAVCGVALIAYLLLRAVRL